MSSTAFDNDRYIALQSDAIRQRAGRFGNKLYLEIGGKLLKDLHAARVLPGFEPDVKLRMLQDLVERMGDQVLTSARRRARSRDLICHTAHRTRVQ